MVEVGSADKRGKYEKKMVERFVCNVKRSSVCHARRTDERTNTVHNIDRYVTHMTPPPPPPPTPTPPKKTTTNEKKQKGVRKRATSRKEAPATGFRNQGTLLQEAYGISTKSRSCFPHAICRLDSSDPFGRGKDH